MTFSLGRAITRAMPLRKLRFGVQSSSLGADCGAQLSDDFVRGFPRGFLLGDFERNSADPGVSAAAVAFTDLGQVHYRLRRGPGVRSHGDFYPETALAQAHTVNRFRMQIVRNEFVVTLEFMIGDVEENGAVFGFDAFAEDGHGPLMTLQKRREQGRNEGLFDDLG